MTWQNLPCTPTLPALFAACPHGWAEIEFTYTSGRPTADPPQDADCSLEVRRLWGIENSDEPALVDLLEELREPPLGMPKRDCILLARMEHHARPCNMCGRQRRADESQWFCFAGDWDAEPLSCPGTFALEVKLRASWGVDGKPAVFVGATPAYGLAAALDHKAATTAKPDPARCVPPPGYEWSSDAHEYVHAVGSPGGPPLWGPITLAEAWKRRDDEWDESCDRNTPRGG